MGIQRNSRSCSKWSTPGTWECRPLQDQKQRGDNAPDHRLPNDPPVKRYRSGDYGGCCIVAHLEVYVPGSGIRNDCEHAGGCWDVACKCSGITVKRDDDGVGGCHARSCHGNSGCASSGGDGTSSHGGSSASYGCRGIGGSRHLPVCAVVSQHYI